LALTRKAAVAAALALGVAALAACSSPAPAAPPPVATAAAAPAPANPVTILRLTGATIPPGDTQGHIGIVGDRVASGTFPSGEQVFVDTYATPADLAAALAAHIPSDGETSLRGPGLSLLDVDCTPGSCTPSPSAIAARIGGKVIGQ
jgi:hypothetical protein